MTWILLLALAAMSTGLQSHKNVLQLNEYANPGKAPVCNTQSYLQTYFLLLGPGTPQNYCQQLVTSYTNYQVFQQDASTVRIQIYGVQDLNCSSTFVNVTVPIGTCFHMPGDNPAVSYKLSFQDPVCPASPTCKKPNQTCCWSPPPPLGNGPGCADGLNDCCCPDFNFACPAGYGCACDACPGPQCTCAFGCIQGGGVCANRNVNDTSSSSSAPNHSLLRHVNRSLLPQSLQRSADVAVISSSAIREGKKHRPTVRVLPNGKKETKCGRCLKFWFDNENAILNELVNAGILGSCEKLCQAAIPNHPFDQFLCIAYCGFKGFTTFMDWLSGHDIDPTWLCSDRFKECPMNTCHGNSCTLVTDVSVAPGTAPLRSKFYISVTVKALATTGVGMTEITFPCPGCNPSQQPPMPANPYMSSGFYNEGLAPGDTETYVMEVNTAEDEWIYAVATNPVAVASCAYDCNDQHGFIFAQGFSNFTITPRQ